VKPKTWMAWLAIAVIGGILTYIIIAKLKEKQILPITVGE